MKKKCMFAAVAVIVTVGACVLSMTMSCSSTSSSNSDDTSNTVDTVPTHQIDDEAKYLSNWTKIASHIPLTIASWTTI